MRRKSLLSGALLIAGAVAISAMLPLVGSAQTRRAVQQATMPAVVMVIAADVVDGRLEPVGSGSGTIVDADGSILTNYHVINDGKNGRLYDLFIIGRYRAADREPEMVCAGHPSRGKLKAQLDLALIKCDSDMNGQPREISAWPTIPIGRSEEIVPGEQVWVFGYPNDGGSTIHVTAGLVSGWTGEEGGSGRAYMKTDAAITHGNSGGTAIDETGKLIGVPTAFRVTTAVQDEQVATIGKVGLIRPIEHARDLVAVARRGWTPTEGENSVPQAPAVEAATSGSEGVIITSKVVDATNRSPVPNAVVVVFKPGVRVQELDSDDLSAHALTWGQTNAGGLFTLDAPLPRGQAYAVAVIAKGYQPLAANNALELAADAPDLLNPWGELRIQKK